MMAGTLEDYYGAINKAYGKTVVSTADKAHNPWFTRRPTGIMELDIHLAGGFVPGINCISGPDSVGKSYLLYQTMAMHQRLYGAQSRLALASVEAPLDHMRLRSVGVMVALPDDVIDEFNHSNKSLGLPSFTKKEVQDLKTGIGTFTNITGATAEDTLGTILDLLGNEKIRKDSQYGIIGVDSLNALVPKAWSMESVDLDENGKMAAYATCLTRFYAQLYPLTTTLDQNTLFTTMLFTQQVRANSAKASAPSYVAKFLPDFAVVSPWAGKHAKIIDLHLFEGKKLKEEGDGPKKDISSKMFGWLVAKGKAGVHEGLNGEIAYHMNGGIDIHRSVYLAGIRYGLLTETKTTVTWAFRGTQMDTMPTKDFIEKLRNEPAYETRLRLQILDVNGKRCRYV